jgi:hypothetical protein
MMGCRAYDMAVIVARVSAPRLFCIERELMTAEVIRVTQHHQLGF